MAGTLARRAAAVFPGGKVTRWPLQALGFGPAFLNRGQGCKVYGHNGIGGPEVEYIDYMSGFGASVLGYCHPAVEEAAAAQAKHGMTLTGPTAVSVDLAERLVTLRPGAEWVILGKNGSDVTTAAARAARAATGRHILLRAIDDPFKGSTHNVDTVDDMTDHKGMAYHGATSQWLGTKPGVLPAESSAHEVGYIYNDLESVARALESTHGDCAAIFVGGCSYPYGGRTELLTPEFTRGLRQLANDHGALLVLDEIRTNFRVGTGSAPGHWAEIAATVTDDHAHNDYGDHPPTCTTNHVNEATHSAVAAALAPDMYCMCKALANGHPIAALVGNAHARDGAAAITASGTYWLSAPPMAAALATLDVLAADNHAAMRHMQAMGLRLRRGLEHQAATRGMDVAVTGPDAMPFMTFAVDDAHPSTRPVAHAWCAAAADGGVWLHPLHNWYLTLAHTEADIDATLAATDAAFDACLPVMEAYQT
eukprot:m.23178 g.23178  ORF g.23178 m.23178 type:complete len:479 (+) comp4061_c0_seq1:42-1478(+)